MTYARAVRLQIVCPGCGDPRIRKVRRVRRMVTLQCKACDHEWRELHDDGISHGLVVLGPTR